MTARINSHTRELSRPSFCSTDFRLLRFQKSEIQGAEKMKIKYHFNTETIEIEVSEEGEKFWSNLTVRNTTLTIKRLADIHHLMQ